MKAQEISYTAAFCAALHEGNRHAWEHGRRGSFLVGGGGEPWTEDDYEAACRMQRALIGADQLELQYHFNRMRNAEDRAGAFD